MEKPRSHSTSRPRSISTSSVYMYEKEDVDHGPMMDFDFSSMISELNLALQEKDAHLLAATQDNAELEIRLRESEIARQSLIEQSERLQIHLEEKTASLQHSLRENDLLRENLYELQTRANELEDVTLEKTTSLERLEKNLHHYEEESEALKRSRAVTCSLIEKAELDKRLLSEEVRNTKRTSFYVQQESVKLGEDLKKSERKLKSLTKTNKRLELQAEEAEKVRQSFMEENLQLREQLSNYKSMVENKTFELIDAQRELVSLREQIDSCQENQGFGILQEIDEVDSERRDTIVSDVSEGWQENQAFGILRQIEDSEMGRKNTNVTNQSGEVEPTEKTLANGTEYEETAGRNSIGEIAPGEPRESIENNNLLFMLHQSEDYEEPGLTEGGSDHNRSESQDLEVRNDEMGWPEIAEDNKHDETMPRISTTKRDVYTANKDMLVVFLYLTAAAVKFQYGEVDIKTADLIHLGQDMAFWELYPFFVSVIESLKEKNAGIETKNAAQEQKKQ
jgi:hypothetical protein